MSDATLSDESMSEDKAQEEIKRLTDLYWYQEEELLKIEESQKVIKSQIQKLMIEFDREVIERDFGKFSIISSVRYTFSPSVQEAELNIKELKEKEKEEGIAKKIESKTIRFTQNKQVDKK